MAVLPNYPDGLADWTCTAFPNDNAPTDSLIVGLVSIAIALPITLFLQGCFALSNDSEAPESFLRWSGWRKLLCGFAAHRRWHYSGPEGQPSRYVRWHVRSGEEPPLITLLNLGRAAAAALTRTPPPWTLEARAAEAAAAEGDGGDGEEAASAGAGEAVALKHFKRALMAAGLMGTYLCWAIMTWFIFTCAHPARETHVCTSHIMHVNSRRPFLSFPLPLTILDGMLIYKLLGADAEASFARSWGVSYGMNAATEWRQVLLEALRAAVILAILERLCLTRNATWLEQHIDYLSLQARCAAWHLCVVWARVGDPRLMIVAPVSTCVR